MYYAQACIWQVLSNSVANALLFTKKEEVAATAQLVDLINKFFD